MQNSSIEQRLTGTPRTRFFLELFNNSGHFVIANILLEILLEGFFNYAFKFELYIIVFGVLIQTYYLSHWQTTTNPRRFLGNLIAPFIYTFMEYLLEGASILTAPNHIAYWSFSLMIGGLQYLRYQQTIEATTQYKLLLILEAIVRTSILFVMYMLLEFNLDAEKYHSLAIFITETSHQFILFSTLLFGLVIGLANVTAETYLQLLRQTSQQLKTYSEWLLGQDLLGQALDNPAALTLVRRERAVLFMDIRGFTAWSEPRSPEEVVTMLNAYFALSENILKNHAVITFKFTGDEVMAIFPTTDNAVSAALALSTAVDHNLNNKNLGAGIGIHAGALVEGLLGGSHAKRYDVIGDTVNTGKRVESVAQKGEVLISASAYESLTINAAYQNERDVSVKGKEKTLKIYRLI